MINIKYEGTSYKERSLSFIQPGVGGRIGAKLSLGSSFSVQAAAEAVGLARGTKLIAGQTVLVDQPPVMITSQLLAGWEF